MINSQPALRPIANSGGVNGILESTGLVDSPLGKSKLVLFLTKARLPILAVGHLLMFCVFYWMALVIRFESVFPYHAPSFFWIGMPVVVSVKLLVFFLLKNFHGWWRYVTFGDLLSLSRAASVSAVVLVFLDYFLIDSFQIPRSVVVIDWAMSIAILSGLRSTWRLWDEQISVLTNGNQKRERALLVGSDSDTAQLAILINSRPNLGVRIVGLVSPHKSGLLNRFGSLQVVGVCDDLVELANRYRAKSVYVLNGKLNGKDLREIVDSGAAGGIQVNVVPGLDSFLNQGTKIPLRPVQYEDLLQRDAVVLDTKLIGDLISGRVVLITGAGGSIGSEICRQLLMFGPKRLILAGRGENRIFHLRNELAALKTKTELCPFLVNITDSRRVAEMFGKFQPEIVFHAAAHKHVHLVEQNPGEAVINNVLGTKIVADAAHDYHVAEFVLISTDKSVNPTSVMGCTKQIAERYCLALGNISETKFVVTRFGNVLGSAGSVVPLFQEQIKNGGPITVTHPEMTRYFMTIPEASQLVLQSAAMGLGSEIFVLDMGQPVRILDLAFDLIRLAGLPKSSIEIVFSGIQPGEKLYEELYYGNEKPAPTQHDKIHIAKGRPFLFGDVSQEIDQLVNIAYGNNDRIRARIKEIVPEFCMDSSQNGSANYNEAHLQLSSDDSWA